MELITNNISDQLVIVELQGRLDVMGTQEIELKFTALASTHPCGLVVDMSGVEFLASVGIRMLLSNAKALANRGGKLVLYRPAPLVEDVLTTAGINQLIPIYSDLEEAKAAVALA